MNRASYMPERPEEVIEANRTRIENVARKALNRAMSEKQLQTNVIELAVYCGWKAHHQTVPYRIGKDGRPRAIVEPHTHPGFPDLALVHEECGLFIVPELKTERGMLSPDQIMWRDALLAAGVDWRLWRPSMWDSEIVPTLTRRR